MELTTMGGGFQSFLSPFASSLGSQLPSILATLLILVIGIWIAKMVRNWCTGYFTQASWFEKMTGPSDKASIAGSLGSLAYYLILLNVLLIVLERMNITTVLEPLKSLALQFMSALPRIIGAAIIFYAGWVIAKLAAGIVEIAAKKLDDTLEKKGFESPFKTSKFLSAFVLGAVLLPIVVAGFEFLAIRAVSVPAIAMISDFMSAVPNIVGAGLILLISYVVGTFVIFMLSGLLEGMNANSIPEKMGMGALFPADRPFVKTVGSVVMFFIMLTAATAAVGKLDIAIVSNAFAAILKFGGGVVLGAVILMIGSFLANIAYDRVSAQGGNKTLATLTRVAILGLVLAMGLRSMGLADNIVTMAFAFTFGSVAIASAIAFGWGGREAARSLTDHWAKQVIQKNSGSKH